MITRKNSINELIETKVPMLLTFRFLINDLLLIHELLRSHQNAYKYVKRFPMRNIYLKKFNQCSEYQNVLKGRCTVLPNQIHRVLIKYSYSGLFDV